MVATAPKGDNEGDIDSDSDSGSGRERDSDSDIDDNVGGGRGGSGGSGGGSGGRGGSQGTCPMVELKPPAADLEALLSMPLYRPLHTSHTIRTTTTNSKDNDDAANELSPDGVLAALRLLLPFSQRDDVADVAPERIKTAVDDAQKAGSEQLHIFT
jgi:hypothetical protein